MMPPKEERITSPKMRKLIAEGGILELETIRLDGNYAWRAQVRMPGNPSVIYRVMVYHSAEIKYFKNLTTAFHYFRAEQPGQTQFSVLSEPVEDITTK